jgi:hypothetical protein
MEQARGGAGYGGHGRRGGGVRRGKVLGNWKSADEIAEDIRKGEVTDLAQLIIDLWRRLDELEREIAKGPKQLQHERRYHRPPGQE